MFVMEFSYIGVEQAKRNLYNEINDFNLEKLASQARDKWNDVLGKIKIEGGTEDQKTHFIPPCIGRTKE